MTIRKVGVLGCGLMGSGIAQVSAQSGFSTTVVEASDELLRRGLDNLRRTLEGLVGRGKMEARTRDEILDRITGTTRIEDLKDCDLVVEAITENQALKNETFARLDRVCPPSAILATNTSSCNVTAMAAATRRPAQVLGLHFFNPVPVMRLVEVVRTLLTSADQGLDGVHRQPAAGALPARCRPPL
jgi:3-hydroxybutyryl-CoA dehydrogenase